ncbi:hypothetical protein [Phenylobacterium sp.]|jgi:hypothetical protein|uniref:hypothetical protein n=1 Tax=Phenylobacterium sp. TaxID=1871053 RepID=UPI002F3E31E7
MNNVSPKFPAAGGPIAPLTYAKVGGPPEDWWGLRIVDLDTLRDIDAVVEVDAKAGWVRHYVRDADGTFRVTPKGDALLVKRTRGRFEIRRGAQP